MRKLLTSLSLLVCIIAGAATAWAQPIPADPEFRIGTLPNGMTYYVRHNEKPRGYADFYLVHRIGSCVEDSSEYGLAHMLEHVSLEGTAHFPGHRIKDYIVAQGANYGADLNAFTSQDQTLFQIKNIKTKDPAVLDTVLLMLCEQASALTLDSAAIEKERNIVIEERRGGDRVYDNLANQVIEQLLQGTPYSHSTIGTLPVLQNFTHSQLADFYHRWYRPEYQAIIAVGDFDAGLMEQRIRDIFGKANNPYPAPQWKPLLIPGNSGLQLAVATNPQSATVGASLNFKWDNAPRPERATVESYKRDWMRQLAALMLNTRLQRLVYDPKAGVGEVEVDNEDFIQTTGDKKAFSVSFSTRNNNIADAWQNVIREIAAARANGFSQSELHDAWQIALSNMENMYRERDNMTNEFFVQCCISHFLAGEELGSFEESLRLTRETERTVTLAQVNEMFRSLAGTDNISLIIYQNNASDLPSRQWFEQTLQAAFDAEYAVGEDADVAARPLMAQRPQPGTIAKRERDAASDITTLTLSNGATVLLKPTNLQKDDILVGALAPGGLAGISPEQTMTAQSLDMLTSTMRVGGFSALEQQQIMMKTATELGFEMNEDAFMMKGRSTVANLETLLQLIHLCYTDTRPDTAAFAAVKQTRVNEAELVRRHSDVVLIDTLMRIYSSDPFYNYPHARELNTVTADQCMVLYRSLMANAADFTFAMVGNFSVDSVEPLLCEYIASLPAGPRQKKRLRIPATGTDQRIAVIAGQEEQSKVSLLCEFKLPQYSYRNEKMFHIFAGTMGYVLQEHLREDLQSTYSVEAEPSVETFSGRAQILITYVVAPDKIQAVYDQMLSLVEFMLEGNVYDDTFSNLPLLQDYELEKSENDNWFRWLLKRGQGIDAITGMDDFYNSLTATQLNNFISSLELTNAVVALTVPD